MEKTSILSRCFCGEEVQCCAWMIEQNNVFHDADVILLSFILTGLGKLQIKSWEHKDGLFRQPRKENCENLVSKAQCKAQIGNIKRFSSSLFITTASSLKPPICFLFLSLKI